MVSKTYRAQNVRRRYIPKGNGKTRPIGIPALEDKIVQQAASKLLQAIYEVDFLDESKGYRPGLGARDASQELREKLFFERVHWVVEADIKSFFDHVDHDWLERMLEERAFEFYWAVAARTGKLVADDVVRIIYPLQVMPIMSFLTSGAPPVLPSLISFPFAGLHSVRGRRLATVVAILFQFSHLGLKLFSVRVEQPQHQVSDGLRISPRQYN